MLRVLRLAILNSFFAGVAAFLALWTFRASAITGELSQAYGMFVLSFVFIVVYSRFAKTYVSPVGLARVFGGATKNGMVKSHLPTAALLCLAVVLLTAVLEREWFQFRENAGGLTLLTLMLLCAGAAFEEALCRGYCFALVRARYSTLVAALISSLFFTFLHYPFAHGGLGFAAHFAFGLAACGLMVRTGSLMPAWAFHLLINLCGDFSKSQYSTLSTFRGLLHFSGKNQTESFLLAEIAVCLTFSLAIHRYSQNETGQSRQ